MVKGGRVPAWRDAPLFAWLGPASSLLNAGTAGYPRPVRRRLAIVNAMALLIAIFSAAYAVIFALHGADYMPLIVVNIVLAAVMFLVPLAHRISDIAGAILIACAEYVALFFFVRTLGHDSGIQINYIVAAAVAFAIYGLSHFRLVVAVIAIGLALHLAAWFAFPPERALIKADPALLANLYVSSAVTTFSIIALVVGYAFTLADRARAVALLDEIVTEFDRLAAAHGVEKIKTTGDGYMAVAGVSRPQDDHLFRLARLGLGLPPLVERLSGAHGVDLKIRIGIASGPVTAGVIGADKFSYDVWGETVNLASRLESHGLPGEVQVSDAVMAALATHFVCEPRGRIAVKGVGLIEAWLVKEERGGERERSA